MTMIVWIATNLLAVLARFRRKHMHDPFNSIFLQVSRTGHVHRAVHSYFLAAFMFYREPSLIFTFEKAYA